MLSELSLLIVVPTLDSFPLLPKLVKSLLSQKFSSWRVLFVDGPSSSQHRLWIENLVSQDARFSWVEEGLSSQGIFGAMNQGFSLARPNEWILFWGSDDWAAEPNALFEVMSFIATNPKCLDLVICSGRYVNFISGELSRVTAFKPFGCLTGAEFRRSLFFGFTPPHQGTLFGPGAISLLANYNTGYRLAADLDYFLRLSRDPGLNVQCLDLELVHMLDGGVSGRQLRRRLQEVCRAYLVAFGFLWWFPFLARYCNRINSLLDRR